MKVEHIPVSLYIFGKIVCHIHSGLPAQSESYSEFKNRKPRSKISDISNKNSKSYSSDEDTSTEEMKKSFTKKFFEKFFFTFQKQSMFKEFMKNGSSIKMKSL